MQIAELVKNITASQHWFNTNKTKALVQAATLSHYGSTRQFSFPAETRFGGKMLQMKRYESMKAALKSVVTSPHYLRFQFEDDVYAPMVTGCEMWDLLDVVIMACGPLLLLLRLADSNAPTLSKLRATVELVKSKMIDTGSGNLTDRIAACFHNRAPLLCSDLANAAYVLDPQFIRKSRNASADIMASFWTVARGSLHVVDDDMWLQIRRQLVAELAAFRMKTGGFAMEDYDTDNACGFWGAAGCHAPVLKKLALRLCPLPCASSEAERNWQELKQNLTKNRNRIDSEKLEKMIFVRRFLRLKRVMCFDDNNPGFKEWVEEMLREAAAGDDSDGGDAGPGPRPADDDVNDQAVFQDHIESDEQGRINGKEPGHPAVTLTTLRRDNAAKSWLYEKYIHMNFVDKNPEQGPDAPALEDETEWEHRVVTNVVWYRRKGHAVETAIRDATVDNQSHEKYCINGKLLQMIRVSPHNTKLMASQLNAATTTAAAAPAADVGPAEGAADAASAVVRSV